MTDNFFNLRDSSQGIVRNLADGVTTRIFPGDQAMLSLVQLEPGTESDVHSHPQEQSGMFLDVSWARLPDSAVYPVTVGDLRITPGVGSQASPAGTDGVKVLDFFRPLRVQYRLHGLGVFSDASRRRRRLS